MADPKAPEDRQRRNKPRPLAETGKISEIPRAPIGLSPALKASWADLWSSPVARLLSVEIDLSVVTRLFRMRALFDLQQRMLKKEYDNALATALTRTSSEIRMLEAKLPLSPRDRLTLGVTVDGADTESLDDMADNANDDDG